MASASDEDVDEYRMPLLEHLVELRQRLLYSAIGFIILFFICYYFAPQIYEFLTRPLAHILAEKGGERRMIFTALQEAFFTYVKVAFFAAMFLSFPLIATQIWKFVAPGLYRQEKAAFLPFLIATPVLFFIGGALAYYVVFPLAWRFFLGFEIPAGEGALPIQLEAKVDQYLGLVMQLIFAFGLCFQMPVVMTLLARVGMVSSQGMREKRRYAIVLAFVAAAVLTPPDIISQVSLAVPIVLLYEISIFCARMVEKRHSAAQSDTEEQDEAPVAAEQPSE